MSGVGGRRVSEGGTGSGDGSGPTADGSQYDFFVSYIDADKKWAEWIAWQLNQVLVEGHAARVFVEAWDIVPGMHAVASRHDALIRSSRVVPVLSEGYLRRSEAIAEWATKWHGNPAGGRIVPVRVKACRPDGLLGSISYIDLVGLNAKTAAERLISRITDALSGRAKPLRPPSWPGLAAERPAISAWRSFPGPPVLVGEPPAVPPNWFQDRISEVEDLERHLELPSTGLVTVEGREGIGKTAMIHQLRDRIQRRKSLPAVYGLVYASAQGFFPVTADRVVASLVEALPAHEVARINELVRGPLLTIEKLVNVLDALMPRQVILVIDAVEYLLDGAGDLADVDLRRIVDYLARDRRRSVRVLLVGQRTAHAVLSRHADAYSRDLNYGLPEPEAFNLLRAMDVDHRFNWDAVSQHDRDRLHRRLKGVPRALEFAYTILAGGRSVSWLLDYLGSADPAEGVVEHLLDWVFSGLPREQQCVLCALAVYGVPVEADAVDHLLGEHRLDDSRPILEQLHRLRLARSDGAFSIPSSEGDHLLRKLAREGGSGQSLLPLGRHAALLRAATYFEGRPADQPKRLDDLTRQLHEIRLLLRAGALEKAFERLAIIEDRILLGWGSSAVVTPLLQAFLRADEITRDLRVDVLSMLGRVLTQQEEYVAATAQLNRALTLARWGDNRRVVLRQQLAATCMLDEDLGPAGRHAWTALRGALLRLNTRETMWALSNVAMHAALGGEFAKAARYSRLIRILFRGRRGVADRTMLPILLLNEAWVDGQLGRTEQARKRLDDAQEAARRIEDYRLQGRCLRGQAELALDDGRLPHAVELAEEAARIGGRYGYRPLVRDAVELLAKVCLCQGNLAAAERAAAIASRSRSTVFGYGLTGLVAYRQGRDDDARTAFRAGCKLAQQRERTNRDNYQLLDSHGLVMAGLSLLDGPPGLTAVLRTYAQARQITRARGAVHRVDLLLKQFAPRADPDRLEEIRVAAAGDRRDSA